MSVVNVRIVRVLVHDRFMVVPVVVGLFASPCEHMLVLVVSVMNMTVTVRHHLMSVFVFVMLGEVQPHAARHQRSSDPERGRGRFAE